MDFHHNFSREGDYQLSGAWNNKLCCSYTVTKMDAEEFFTKNSPEVIHNYLILQNKD
jgi:hypothetical protein